MKVFFRPASVFSALPVTTKLASIPLVFTALIVLLIGSTWFCLDTMSSIRAYVGGEGHWSKSQKDAVISLLQYEASHDERDFEAYQRFIGVTQGDKAARLELEKPAPDYAVVRAGFLAGQNHPDDIPGMAALFRRFRHLSYLDKAIGIWAQADAHVVELDDYARRLHRVARAPTPAEFDAARARIGRYNRALTVLEDQFSETLGEAARWTTRLLTGLLMVTAGLFLAMGLGVCLRLSRYLSRELGSLQQGALRIAGGNFDERIPSTARDEIGALAATFNRMTDSLIATQQERRLAEAATEQALDQEASRTRELEAANAELQQLDRLKDQFLGILSHELRTPINAITGFGSVMDDEVMGPLNEQQHYGLQKMLDATNNLLALVDDLLDMSRIQAGKFTIAKSPLNFPALATAAYEQIAPLATRKGLQLAYAVPAELPTLQGDAHRVSQVLTNLLTNAIKFTHAGGTVQLKARLDGEVLRCEVSDTGIGILAADLHKLFKRFSQLDMSNARPAGGTGMGLSIVKALVEAHEGEVGVTSTPGSGSTFWFTLPLDRA